MKTAILLVSLAVALVVAPVTTGASEEMPIVDPPAPSCEDGSTGDPSVDITCVSVPDTEEGPVYYSPVEGVVNPCRAVVQGISGKTIAGHVLWTYWQRVRWCWNGVKITKVERDRYVSCCSPIWDFKGHIQGSCYQERCEGKKGNSSAYIMTQGKFEACVYRDWICQRGLPGLTMTIYANGTRISGRWL